MVKIITILIVLALIFIGPFLTVTAFATLFPAAGVVFSWKTWLAAFWLHAVFVATIKG